MLVFAIVALRLIGLWLFVSQLQSPMIYLFSMLGWTHSFPLPADTEMSFALFSIAAAPSMGGLIILVAARPIARLIVPAEVRNAEQPASVSAAAYTQIGIFLVGLWTLVIQVPSMLVLIQNPSFGFPLEQWARLAIGLALVFGSGTLAGLIKHLRKWP